jgi:N-acetylglucosaminyl-diphospho-decaprenol L-rhamnosyltransferase
MVRIIRHDILPALAAAGEGASGGAFGQTAERPAVSIIVVSYNTRDMTMACLLSVFEQTRDVPCEVIVVDNASTDSSAQAIAALGDRVRFMPLSDNIGFARANNLAALKARGDHLLLLNPDTVVLDGAIDRLAAFAYANPTAGIWGGRTLFGDRQLDATSVWARMTPWSIACRALGLDKAFPDSAWFNPEGMGGWKRDSLRRVDIVTGCFLMIRRELWDRLGGFDRAFFMYGEEADLCLRAAKLGARPLFTPTATIIHYGGASEATQAGKVVKLFRAKVTLMQRHWSAPAKLFGREMLRVWALSRWLAASLVSSSDKRSAQAEMWREVWQRRAVWMHGWDAENVNVNPSAGKVVVRG